MQFAIVVVTVLLLIIPSNQSAFFNGLPFSSIPELSALVLLGFVVGFRSLRTVLISSLSNWSRRFTERLFVILVMIIVVKSAMYVMVPTTGQYEVCYRHFNARQGVACAPTFEPVPSVSNNSEHFVSRSTQVAGINFGPRVEGERDLSTSNWRLPLVNSFEADRGYWPWNPQELAIETFPFWAEYRARVEFKPGQAMRITYVGQGRVVVDLQATELPPAYDRPKTVELNVPEGAIFLAIDYAFLRPSTNDSEQTRAYARLKVEKVSRDGFSILRPDMPLLIRGLNALVDAATLLMLIVLIWNSRTAWRYLRLGLGLAVVTALTGWSGREINLLSFRVEYFLLFLILITLIWKSRQNSFLTLAPSYLVSAITWTFSELNKLYNVPFSYDTILVRPRGNDHLVYHAFAREMLASGFFRGGEDVFYFQPGIRFVYYIESLLLGESGVLLGIFNLAALGFAMLAVMTRLGADGSWLTSLGRLIGCISLLVWWSSSHTIQSTILGLSEFGTWILVFTIFSILLRNVRTIDLVVIGVLAASVTWIRPNQGLAMLILVVLASYVHSQFGVRGVLSNLPGIGTFSAALAVIPVHNLVYGKQLVLLPRGHLNADQQSWGAILRVFSDNQVREFMTSQLRGLVYLPSVLPEIFSPRLALALLGFAFVGVLALVQWSRTSKRDWISLVLLTLVVLGQVFPFFKYSLFRYFPIHNVAIYLAFVLSSLLLLSDVHTRRRSASQTDYIACC